jgi:hypothetical protein
MFSPPRTRRYRQTLNPRTLSGRASRNFLTTTIDVRGLSGD